MQEPIKATHVYSYIEICSVMHEVHSLSCTVRACITAHNKNRPTLFGSFTFTTAAPWYNNITFSTQLYGVCITVHHTMGYTQLPDWYSTQERSGLHRGDYIWVQFSMTAWAGYWTKVSVVCEVRFVCSHATLQTLTHMYRLSLKSQWFMYTDFHSA